MTYPSSISWFLVPKSDCDRKYTLWSTLTPLREDSKSEILDEPPDEGMG